LFGQRRCRDRKCHGCCADADCGGNVCESGTCSDCPRGQRLCRGGCIAEETCCTDDECSSGRVCIAGTCGCGPDRQLCEGVCIPADACCGTECPVESCTPANCSGCCDGNTCRNGDSANFCGRSGVACVQCDAGEACDAGVCVGGGGTCSPTNCNGCCDGTTCSEGDSQNFCGRGGDPCNQCDHGVACDAGHCGCRNDDDCSESEGGRCRPNGACVYPPNCDPAGTQGSCGILNCCNSGTCQVGTAQTCQPGAAGKPCHTNADCTSGICDDYLCL
jgi:hypothetical protein